MSGEGTPERPFTLVPLPVPPGQDPRLRHQPLAHGLWRWSLSAFYMIALAALTASLCMATGYTQDWPGIRAALGLMALGAAVATLATTILHNCFWCAQCRSGPTLGWAALALPGHYLRAWAYAVPLMIVVAGMILMGVLRLGTHEDAWGYVLVHTGMLTAVTGQWLLVYHARAQAWCAECPWSERSWALLLRLQGRGR